jgi:hypothetical protein
MQSLFAQFRHFSRQRNIRPIPVASIPSVPARPGVEFIAIGRITLQHTPRFDAVMLTSQNF